MYKLEQDYRVDPNTVRLSKGIKILGLQIHRSSIVANGREPHSEDKFILMDLNVPIEEAVRKLKNAQTLPSEKVRALGSTYIIEGRDYVIGPKFNKRLSIKDGQPVRAGKYANPSVWLRLPEDLRGVN